MNTSAPKRPAFGTVLHAQMAVARFSNGAWSEQQLAPTRPVEIHPAAHVLHYGSSCFEGFKAYRWADGSINVFRMDRHIERMRQSARSLVLPEPDRAQLEEMVRTLVQDARTIVPEAPGALYLRPLLFGTTANIGAASTPTSDATLIVLASPVWDYFEGGMRPLRILIDDRNTRSAANMGSTKTGGNYAAALAPTLAARAEFQTDQVLFCPGGEVQETGAANFILMRPGQLLTRSLDLTFLHGVTRDSVLQLARASGFRVDERVFDVAEMLDWVRTGEAALSGTAAVLAGVGTLVYQGKDFPVGTGDVGEITRQLRASLTALQRGEIPDSFGWMTKLT